MGSVLYVTYELLQSELFEKISKDNFECYVSRRYPLAR